MRDLGPDSLPAPQIRKRVYVVGCYRSGTTLLERVFGCHHDVVGLGFETLLFTHVLPRRRLPAFNEGLWQEVLERHFGVARWDQVPGDARVAFDSIAERLARDLDASIFVEKTPFHLFHVDQILKREPEAKILHAVRDGRDVVTSVLAARYPLGRWRNRRARMLAACALWEWFAFEGMRLADHHAGRFHTVRYEELACSPRETLAGMARFLGLELSDEELEAWLARTRRVDSNSSFESMQGISDRGVQRWRDPNRLPPADAELLDRLLAPTLSLVGYEPGEAGVALPGERPARMGKFVCAAARIARFRGNVGYWPPPRAGSFLRHSLRVRNPDSSAGS